jgi:ABC-type branched-subunit amino acid transport system ATPase component
MKKVILKVNNINKSFGGVSAIRNVSFEIEQGSITGLIGPNGAGKTVLFNLITGLDKLDSGEIYFNDERIDHLSTPQIINKGIRRSFQILRVFPKMTVFDNILVAMQDKSLLQLINFKRNRDYVREIDEILEFVGLLHLKNELAKNLSYGQAKLLEFAITVAGRPEAKLILLDEPFSGVNPVLRDKLIERILELREKKGKTFMIIEHQIKSIVNICDKLIVLHLGEKIAEGIPSEIVKNEKVINAYLGG